MGKTYIEICLVSGRQLLFGAGFGSKLLKHKWYAVGWIDPEDKYCTTIYGSRSDNPLWGTKFITSLDDDDGSKIQNALHVEVYSREPIFLTKRLHGSVTVPLKEILAKYKNQSSSSSVFEETRSCQVRKQNSSKPRGFVNVSIRISAERQDFEDLTGLVILSTNSGNNSSGQNYMDVSSQHPFATSNYQPNSSNSFSFPPDNHHFPMPDPLMQNASAQTQQHYYPPPPPPMQQPYYPPPPMQQPCYPSAPPLPPATSNAGYMPSNMPRLDNAVNIPSSSSSFGGYARPGSAGLGAGAIAAGDPALHGRDVYLT